MLGRFGWDSLTPNGQQPVGCPNTLIPLILHGKTVQCITRWGALGVGQGTCAVGDTVCMTPEHDVEQLRYSCTRTSLAGVAISRVQQSMQTEFLTK